LCEIEREVAASLRPGIDHHVAHARLQWWRDEADRTLRGQPVHPLTRALLKAKSAESLVASAGAASVVVSERLARSSSWPVDVSGFVDTGVWDLASATFEARKELTAYCERWAAAMFEGTAAVAMPHAGGGQAGAATDGGAVATVSEGLRAKPARISSHWRTLGAAVREVELLANVGPEAHAGRLRVPLDELERAGVDPKDVSRPPWPAALAALLRERHVALRSVIANGVAAVGSEAQTSARGLMVWAALAWRISLRAEAALPGMIATRRYQAFVDGWQAWRAARRATTGMLRLG
jgi:phytoene synthase